MLDKNVASALEKFGIQTQVIPCDDEYADTVAFCEHYGYNPGQSANTILVSAKNEPSGLAACVLLATTKLDVNKKVCQLMGVKRASFASAEQTIAVSGMKIGGVVAIGLPSEVPVYVDAEVMNQPEIIMGGGNRTSKLILAPGELLKLPNVTVVEGLALPKVSQP